MAAAFYNITSLKEQWISNMGWNQTKPWNTSFRGIRVAVWILGIYEEKKL